MAGTGTQGDRPLEYCRLRLRVVLFDQRIENLRLLPCCGPRLCDAVEKVDTFPRTCHGAIFDLGPMMSYGREEMCRAGCESDIEQGWRRITESKSLMICTKKRVDTGCRSIASLFVNF